jgi:hypothetical protein
MSLTDEDRAKRIAYVTSALRLNPLRDSAKILAARNAALGLLKESNIEAPVDIQQLRINRQNVLATLDCVRTNFWSASDEEMNQELAVLESAEFPDLKETIARLQLLARFRAQFNSFVEAYDPEQILAGFLKKILVAPSRDTAGIKERLLHAFRRPLWRRTPRRIIRNLDQQLPEVYALEGEWFAALLNQKISWIASAPPSANKSRDPRSDGTGRQHRWWYGLAFVVLLQLIRALLGLQ